MRRNRSSDPFKNADVQEMDMSSMIDVAFLLLIYFLVATTMMQEEADLGLSIPGAAAVGGRPVKIDPMRLRIDAQSAVWVNDEMVDPGSDSRDLPTLFDRLQRYTDSVKLGGAEAMVILECHDEAREQRFVDVLNSCQALGIDNIALAQ